MNETNETAPPAGEKTLGQVLDDALMSGTYRSPMAACEGAAAVLIAEYLRRNPAAPCGSPVSDKSPCCSSNAKSDTQMSELLPCPFCGCEGEYADGGTTGSYVRIECVECSAEAGFSEDAAEAAAAWNRRNPAAGETRTIWRLLEEGDIYQQGDERMEPLDSSLWIPINSIHCGRAYKTGHIPVRRRETIPAAAVAEELADALEKVMPTIDDMYRENMSKAMASPPNLADKWTRVAECYMMQAEYIRALLAKARPQKGGAA